MERTFEVVTEAVVQVELRIELPRVAGVEEPRIYKYLALLISLDDRCVRGLASKKVGESVAIAVISIWISRRAFVGRKNLAAIECERADDVALIEGIKLCLTVFAAETHLVFALGPGELICDVASDVVASLGRREADGIKVFDGNVWGVGESGSGDEAKALNVVVGFVVVEDLVEVVDTGKELVGHAG